MSKKSSMELVSESDRLLRTIDKQTSQATIAQRVDRLLESAAPAINSGLDPLHIWWIVEIHGLSKIEWSELWNSWECPVDCSCADYDTRIYRDDLDYYFTVCSSGESPRKTYNNRDAMIYQTALLRGRD